MQGAKMLIIYCFLFYTIRTATARDTLNLGQSIRDGETLVSANESFELGFFSPGKSQSRYLGIWYKKIGNGTVIWVANRDAPLSDRSGALNISSQGNGTLVLLNSTNGIVWSSNASRTARNPVAVLLESGNLVVKDGKDIDPDNFLWQSFDYPSHILIAGMKLGVNLVTGLNRFISSWKSADDPAQDDYVYGIDPSGVPQAVFRKGSTIRYRAGSWNGLHWTGMPQLQPNPVYTFEYVSNKNEVFYRFNLIKSSVPSMMVMNPLGDPQRLTWMEQTQKWAPFVPFSGLILDQCDNYALCGAYAVCNMNSNSAKCECLEGFVPKSPSEWDLLDKSDGCVRRTQLDCEHGDGFLKHESVKLPDTRFSMVDNNISLLECKELCSKNCSCTAYANADVRGGGSGCLLWFHDLIDMKELSESGQDLFVRMAASELDDIERKKPKKKKKVAIVITSVLLVTGVILLGGFVYLWKRRHRKQGKTDGSSKLDYNDRGNRKEDMELPIFDWMAIANATDNFSDKNKLGEGGFGPVYKGVLIEGQEIAVKRLSKSSGQGMEEFENEVLLIAKLQHRNLVKLIGCCVICGQPSSGKSLAATCLAEALKESEAKETVRIIDEASFHLDRNQSYASMPAEKNLRGVLRSEVDRSVSKDNIIIVDSLNSIKGYRYELWCLARAAGIRYCVLYCDLEEDHCRKWNKERREKGEAAYDDKIFEDLVRRFEKPDRRNRWDSPLFELCPYKDGIENSSAAILDAVAYLTKKVDSKSRDVKILQPTIATQNTRFSEANSLYELDRATQEVINAIVEAQSKALGGPMNGISLGQGLPNISISRSVGLPELRRLRRTFIKLTGQTSLSGPPPPSDADSAKRMFVDYLNRELETTV